jgi:predicted transcriptional regulator YdeE
VKFRKESIFVLATVLLASLAIAQTKSATQTAKAKTIHQDEFFIVGIEARTSAAKETSGEGVIPTQWQKFAVEGVLAKIPNKADQNVYQVYTDFANKRYGEYSVVLGARVAD